MLLSGDDDQLLVGNFIGDFVKGPLQGRFQPRVRQGVTLHRKIDSFADHNEHFRRSRLCLSGDYGRYRAVMVDMFYDYYLVNSWGTWSHEPFADYLARTRKVVEEHHHELPPEMHRMVPIIFEELLPSYGTIEGIGSALSRLSNRITRPNPLSGAEVELLRQHDALQTDFNAFTPEIRRFVDELVGSGGL